MSQAYHVRHESHSSSPGYPAPYPPPTPPPQAPAPPGYPRGYQGYLYEGYSPPSVTPPPLRPYDQYYNYGIGCSSLLRACLATLCCCCILDECCF